MTPVQGRHVRPRTGRKERPRPGHRGQRPHALGGARRPSERLVRRPEACGPAPRDTHRPRRARSRGRVPRDAVRVTGTRQMRALVGETPRHCGCEDKADPAAAARPPAGRPAREPRDRGPLHGLRFTRMRTLHVCAHTRIKCVNVHVKRERKRDNYML